MGVLGNQQHERFCQELHKLIWAGGNVKDSRIAAYGAVGYESNPACIADNARKLANRPAIKARLSELGEYSATLAGIDAGWAQRKLKSLVECNLADYMSPAGTPGRPFDLTNVSHDKMGLLLEVATEEEHKLIGDDEGADPESVAVRKVKIKRSDPIAALGLMARIGGWEAPKKIAPTNPAGDGPAETVHVHIAARDAVVF